MASFKDSTGNLWSVRITVADLRTLKELDAHPDKLLSDGLKPLGELLSDSERVVSVLYILTGSHGKVEPEDFARIFDGDTLESGSKALLDAITDFIPSARREPLRALQAKLTEIGSEMNKQALDSVSQIDVKTVVELALKNTATDSPDKSELTPVG